MDNITIYSSCSSIAHFVLYISHLCLCTISPKSQEVAWERSYYGLRTIYDQAIKKFNCDVSIIRFVQLEDGKFKATIDVSAYPHEFWGPSATTKVVAKAKLLYTVIKYVNEQMGCPVIDLHYGVRKHQDTFIRRFDHKMDGIFRYAERLKRMMDSTGQAFARHTADLTVQMSSNVCSDVVYERIEELSGKLLAAKTTFDASWTQLLELKVTSFTLAS